MTGICLGMGLPLSPWHACFLRLTPDLIRSWLMARSNLNERTWPFWCAGLPTEQEQSLSSLCQTCMWGGKSRTISISAGPISALPLYMSQNPLRPPKSLLRRDAATLHMLPLDLSPIDRASHALRHQDLLKAKVVFITGQGQRQQ